MDIVTAANALDGSEYRKEGSRELFAEMKAAGLVAAFGASDDLLEFRGAIDDEVGAYEGVEVRISNGDLVKNECRDSDCPNFNPHPPGSFEVKAEWDADGYSWKLSTDTPCHYFEVVEDGEKYCRGIVFKI